MRMLATIAVLLALVATPAQAVITDGVVAAIGFKVVALSMLEAYRAAFAPEQPAALALDQLIDERLLANEARRYGLLLDPTALAAAIARYPKPPTITPAEWEALVADHLLARQFLDFRFADFVPIPREELLAYYRAHESEFTEPFEVVEERIRARLTPAVRARREAAYVEELRLRGQVRLNPKLIPRD